MTQHINMYNIIDVSLTAETLILLLNVCFDMHKNWCIHMYFGIKSYYPM